MNPPRPSARRHRGLWLAAPLLCAAGIFWWRWLPSREKAPQYRTARVTVGCLTNEVTASGQLNPVVKVLVGSQISGTIQTLRADFNSTVTNGQVVAQLDPATYQAVVHQNEGELAKAQAALELAEFNARQARALFEKRLTSESEHAAAMIALSQAKAECQIRQAALPRARATRAAAPATSGRLPGTGRVLCNEKGTTMKTHFACIALAAAIGPVAEAADWPRLRGPDGSGIAADAHPPAEWNQSKNLRWKVALPGPGSSSPIVSGERVVVTCYSGYGDGSASENPGSLRRHLLCIDRASGRILWDQAVPAEGPEDPFAGYLSEHGYASHTPATDGRRVYVFFGKTGVLAFDFSGRQLWRTDVGKQSSRRRWGSAASLMLYKNLVIVNAAEESRMVLALDAASGKEVWRAPSLGLELCYSTPVLAECGGGRSDIVVAVPQQVWALNPDTGKLRWFANTGIGGNLSPSVAAADNVVFVTGGFPRQGTVAVRGGGSGDVTGTSLLWSSETASYVPSPLIHGGNLYFVSDLGFAACMDARTGNLLHRERLPGMTGGGRGSKAVYASVILAGGRLYAVSRRSGAFVLGATPQMPILAQNVLAADDSDFNATPAICGNQIFLRSNRFAYCVQGPEK